VITATVGDGVESVTTAESAVDVAITDATAKIDIARRLDERTEVFDIISEDTSLEKLFNTYTSNGQTPESSPDEEPPVMEADQ